MREHSDVIDCDAGRAWRPTDEEEAVRLAAGRRAATGAVIEVIRHSPTGDEQLLVLPPRSLIAQD
jgi:hypothetical protein